MESATVHSVLICPQDRPGSKVASRNRASLGEAGSPLDRRHSPKEQMSHIPALGTAVPAWLGEAFSAVLPWASDSKSTGVLMWLWEAAPLQGMPAPHFNLPVLCHQPSCHLSSRCSLCVTWMFNGYLPAYLPTCSPQCLGVFVSA